MRRNHDSIGLEFQNPSAASPRRENARGQQKAARMLAFIVGTAISVLPGSIRGHQMVPAAQAGSLPTAIESLRPISGASYDPAPSDDPLGSNGNVPGGPAANRSFVYEDSDFFNDDFKALWAT